jgi:hypothetical protein
VTHPRHQLRERGAGRRRESGALACGAFDYVRKEDLSPRVFRQAFGD